MIAKVRKLQTADSIATISNLAKALDLDKEQLISAAELNEKYTVSSRAKSDGTIRVVHNPKKLIRLVQSRIKNRIFREKNIIEWGGVLFGSIPNNGDIARDYVNCAAQHCGAKALLKVDVSSFFDNIHEDLVYRIFEEFFNYPPIVSGLLTKICTYEGRVPQGGLTSSYLASLALFDVEHLVANRLARKNLVYTRYVDDITVSAKVHNYDFSYALKIIEDMLYQKELPMNASKTVLERAGTQGLTVHGLRVSHDTVRLPKEEVRNIRAAVKRIEELSKEPNYRTSFSYRKDFNRCMGRVNKLGRVGHNQADALVNRLNLVQPLPSPKDVERCKDVVQRLKRDYEAIGHTNSYRVRFYRCHERLNILKRKYEKLSGQLRGELKSIKPPSKK